MIKALFFIVGAFLFSMSVEAQTLCANKDGVKLRGQPSPQAKVTWTVQKYMPFQYMGKVKGAWYQVADVDDQKHWIHRSDFSAKQRCLVVRTKSTSLRKGPGAKFQLSDLGTATRYTPFKDLGGEDGWTQVQDADGSKAWVHLDSVWKPSHRFRVSFSGD